MGTALKLYNQMGEKIYCESLRLIVAAWEGKPDSFRASVLRGVMHFVELYHGEFSEERLIRALGNVHTKSMWTSTLILHSIWRIAMNLLADKHKNTVDFDLKSTVFVTLI